MNQITKRLREKLKDKEDVECEDQSRWEWNEAKKDKEENILL